MVFQINQNQKKTFQYRLQKKTAVNNLNLNIYENQITGLLGNQN